MNVRENEKMLEKNERRVSLPDHFNYMTNVNKMFSDPEFSIWKFRPS